MLMMHFVFTDVAEKVWVNNKNDDDVTGNVYTVCCVLGKNLCEKVHNFVNKTNFSLNTTGYVYVNLNTDTSFFSIRNAFFPGIFVLVK